MRADRARPNLARVSRTSSARRIPRVLSIAGSDSGGGAGIQADLKAFAACGAHGMTAITAITAQNTVGVTAVKAIEPAMILAQVAAVAQDIGVDAVKIGMLGTVATIEAVAQALQALDELGEGEGRGGRVPVVLDPVMVAESGAQLLADDARDALVELLLARATVVTPNLPEARALVGGAVGGEGDPGPDAEPDAEGDAEPDAVALARAVRALGPEIVVVTGGHRAEATDVFFDGRQIVEIPGKRYPDGAAHGSGCTHSSVLAARLAWGDSPLQAARTAKRRAAAAVRDGLTEVGAGTGPVDVLGVT
jgi:hydroxymethylpyrimidine/phosphomethylpyrimidine kinase